MRAVGIGPVSCLPCWGPGRFLSFLVTDYKRWRLHLKLFDRIPTDRRRHAEEHVRSRVGNTTHPLCIVPELYCPPWLVRFQHGLQHAVQFSNEPIGVAGVLERGWTLDGPEAEDQARSLNEDREGASSATHQPPDN